MTRALAMVPKKVEFMTYLRRLSAWLNQSGKDRIVCGVLIACLISVPIGGVYLCYHVAPRKVKEMDDQIRWNLTADQRRWVWDVCIPKAIMGEDAWRAESYCLRLVKNR